jgi:hypothetical protein
MIEKTKGETERDKPKPPISGPAIPIGNCMLFGVDQVNGPSSERKEVPISRHEALVLARHWIEEHEDCAKWLRIQYSSKDQRIKVYAATRISELYDYGMITQKQIDKIVEEIHSRESDSQSPATESPVIHDVKPEDQFDALMWSVELGDMQSFRELLDQGVALDARGPGGTTMLHAGASAGDRAVVLELLERDADPNVRNDRLATPLHDAAVRGQAEMVKVLIAHRADPNARTEDGQTPLHFAARLCRDMATFRELLAGGADPNACTKAGETPLQMVHHYNNEPKIADLLLEASRSASPKNWTTRATHQGPPHSPDRVR